MLLYWRWWWCSDCILLYRSSVRWDSLFQTEKSKRCIISENRSCIRSRNSTDAEPFHFETTKSSNICLLVPPVWKFIVKKKLGIHFYTWAWQSGCTFPSVVAHYTAPIFDPRWINILIPDWDPLASHFIWMHASTNGCLWVMRCHILSLFGNLWVIFGTGCMQMCDSEISSLEGIDPGKLGIQVEWKGKSSSDFWVAVARVDRSRTIQLD